VLVAGLGLGGLTKPHRLKRLRKKDSNPYVILSEARNLSFLSWSQIEERFFASLRMTKQTTFYATCEVCAT
jgi:hypothetical protein